MYEKESVRAFLFIYKLNHIKKYTAYYASVMNEHRSDWYWSLTVFIQEGAGKHDMFTGPRLSILTSISGFCSREDGQLASSSAGRGCWEMMGRAVHRR